MKRGVALAGVVLLLVGVLLRASRPRETVVETPAPAAPVPATRPAPPASATASSSVGAPAREGRALDRAAVERRLTLCLQAGLTGDRPTFEGLKRGLAGSAATARAAVQGRLDRAPRPEERRILDELLREIP